jgi:2-dehydropantoate 2-reductase
MYTDIVSNKPTEIDYLQGEISRLGREHNIATPVCDRVVQLVKRVEKEGRGVTLHTGDEILDALELL